MKIYPQEYKFKGKILFNCPIIIKNRKIALFFINNRQWQEIYFTNYDIYNFLNVIEIQRALILWIIILSGI